MTICIVDAHRLVRDPLLHEQKDQKLISIILLSVAALMSMPLLYSVLTCVGIVRKPKRIRVVAVKPGSYINTEESS